MSVVEDILRSGLLIFRARMEPAPATARRSEEAEGIRSVVMPFFTCNTYERLYSYFPLEKKK